MLRDFRKRPRILNGHPVVRFLFEELYRQRMCEQDLADRSGINRDTLRNWRTRNNPRVTDLEATLQCLGYKLKAVKIYEKNE